MIKMIKKLLDLEQSRFVIVGIMNTIIGAAAMLVAYNIFHLGYWISSAMDYIIGSIFSYFANKYFTFKSNKKSKTEVLRFTVNIVICYLGAYGIARPVIDYILKNEVLSKSFMDQISMFLGMGIFIIFNYFGQKYFVFKNETGDL